MSIQADETSDDRIRDAITLAKNMRNNGAALEVIEARLARRGFDALAIEAVLRHVPKEMPNNMIIGKDPSTGGRWFLVAVGLAVFCLGVLIAIGNQSGAVPTVPFFGFVFMIIGGAIMGAGRS